MGYGIYNNGTKQFKRKIERLKFRVSALDKRGREQDEHSYLFQRNRKLAAFYNLQIAFQLAEFEKEDSKAYNKYMQSLERIDFLINKKKFERLKITLQ